MTVIYPETLLSARVANVETEKNAYKASCIALIAELNAMIAHNEEQQNEIKRLNNALEMIASNDSDWGSEPANEMQEIARAARGWYA